GASPAPHSIRAILFAPDSGRRPGARVLPSRFLRLGLEAHAEAVASRAGFRARPSAYISADRGGRACPARWAGRRYREDQLGGARALPWKASARKRERLARASRLH